MTDNLPINTTQDHGFNVNINVNLNNGVAATALFVVLGVCIYTYINAKNNYTTTISYNSNSLKIIPSTTITKA